MVRTPPPDVDISIGSQSQIPIHSSNVLITQLKLDKSRKALLERKKRVAKEKNKHKEPPRRSKRKASEVSSKAPGNSAPRKLPSGPKQPGDPLYCWSHGKGHASGGTVNPCRNPKDGHIYSADFRNQHDGVPAY